MFGGIGFTIAIVIMAGIREELDFCDVPEALKGAAITLVVAGILSMAFMGFTGVDTGLKNALKKESQQTSAIQQPETNDFPQHALQIPFHPIQNTGKEKLS
jgi:electron transport complex protein RnfA